MRRTFFFAAILALAGCNTTSGTDSGPAPGTDGGNDAFVATVDAFVAPTVDGGSDAFVASTTDANVDANTNDAGCTGVLLTVIDSSSWCDITVAASAAFGGETETVCVPASTDVALTQRAHSGFILGNWFGTDDDHGTGDPGHVDAMVSTAHVMTGAAGTSACVSVCCPFPGGTGCPATNACP